MYGSLAPDDPPFTETSPYQPNSPYSASKAASDHLVRAWRHTYGLPVTISNCSNNYGPFHFPEKLIPLVITNALAGKPLPIYGDGLQVRDWLYVTDHCSAIRRILEAGQPGEVYNVGGWNEMTNIQIVTTILRALPEARPPPAGREEPPHAQAARPGGGQQASRGRHRPQGGLAGRARGSTRVDGPNPRRDGDRRRVQDACPRQGADQALHPRLRRRALQPR